MRHSIVWTGGGEAAPPATKPCCSDGPVIDRRCKLVDPRNPQCTVAQEDRQSTGDACPQGNVGSLGADIQTIRPNWDTISAASNRAGK